MGIFSGSFIQGVSKLFTYFNVQKHVLFSYSPLLQHRYSTLSALFCFLSCLKLSQSYPDL